jgi:hypothetical protein
MIDNNLLLLIAIGVIIFLIINLNTSKNTSENMSNDLISENENVSNKLIPENLSENFDNQTPSNFLYNDSKNKYAQNYNTNEDTINKILSNSDYIINSPSNKFINNAPAPLSSGLNNSYNNNLKGNTNQTISSNTTKISSADFGTGYSLGVDTKDPSLSKFVASAPIQPTQLISDDLLPKKNETWFETPSVGTKLDDANLLADAIYKVGVDTVGSTRKNPSYDIRGTIPNSKFSVSPWNNSSYEPDNNLKSLC